jgi:hypothetical protein
MMCAPQTSVSAGILKAKAYAKINILLYIYICGDVLSRTNLVPHGKPWILQVPLRPWAMGNLPPGTQDEMGNLTLPELTHKLHGPSK